MSLFPNFDAVVFLSVNHIGFKGRLLSLFIGLTAPLINLPFMLWIFVFKPIFIGFGVIVSFWYQCAVYGIAGYVGAIEKDGTIHAPSGLSGKRR